MPKFYRHALVFITFLVGACSVSEVDIRLNKDLSGRFTTILAVNREIESCAKAPRGLQDLVKDVVSRDADLATVLLHSPYNVGRLGGVRTAFDFATPDDISIRIGQIQRLNLAGEEEDEESELQEQMRELLAQADSLPVDFQHLISPSRHEDGRTIWTAEFRGDPGVLANLNFGDDPSSHCSPTSIKFLVTMPAQIIEFSPKSGRATAIQRGTHTVEWQIPREGGEVVLKISAAELDPESATESATDSPGWTDLQTWIIFATFLTALIGVLTAWKKFRSDK